MVEEGTISPADLNMFHLTDDPEDAVEYIVKFHREAIRPAGSGRIRSPLPPARRRRTNSPAGTTEEREDGWEKDRHVHHPVVPGLQGREEIPRERRIAVRGNRHREETRKPPRS